MNVGRGEPYELGDGYNHFAMTVEDLDALLAKLSQLGVEPEKPPFHPGGRDDLPRIAFVADPDGYRVRLHRGRRLPDATGRPAPLSLDRPAAVLDSAVVPSFRAAYLIHGDDHGRIGERRARLRAMAEAESGSAASRSTRASVHARGGRRALSAMTFALGRRFVIADGVERWKDADVEPVASALAGHRPGDADRRVLRPRGGPLEGAAKLRQGGRGGRGPDRRRESRQAAGSPALGDARRRAAGARAGPRRPPARWSPRSATASSGCCASSRSSRSSTGRARAIGVQEVEESCASSAERKLWTLADALVAGDAGTATRALLELRQQGERVPGLHYNMVRRLRDALVGRRGARGRPAAAQIKKGLRMPGFAADQLIADVVASVTSSAAARAAADGRPRGREPRRQAAACSARNAAAVRAVIAAAG